MSHTFQKLSFTLIEMLIVIVIIGILAAALVPRLQEVQSRARDAKRKTDAAQIQSAVMIYNTDNSGYPPATNTTTACANDTNCYVYSTEATTWAWINAISGLMTTIPRDPLNNGTFPWSTDTNYSYAYGNIRLQSKTFTLITKLENKKDPQRCELAAYKLYAWSIVNCSSVGWCGTYCPYLYVRSDTAWN